jgi:hypothetical protein
MRNDINNAKFDLDQTISIAKLTAEGFAPYQAAGIVWTIARASRAYGRINEAACNWMETDEAERKHDRIKARLEKALIPEIFSRLTFQGDPRGRAIGIKFPDGAYNNMGGEDWRV